MIGRFIFICDHENLICANRAAVSLLKQPAERELMVAYGDNQKVWMFAKRLKKSIRVQQVKP